MSSMRNAVQRRSHRERAQPTERRRLGLLEKHKDYRLRAQDWNRKKAILQNLRQKAADRNEDEFSYKMLSRARGPGSALTRGSDEKRDRHWMGTVDGGRSGSKSLSVDTVRLLKTQDTGYLRTMRNVLAKETQRLEERLAVTAALSGSGQTEEDDDDDMDDDDDDDKKISRRRASKPTKIVFAESAEKRDAAVEEEGGDEDEDEDEDDNDNENDNTHNKRRSGKADATIRLQRRLATARRRLEAITAAEQELDLQRARMAKTATVDMVTRKGKRIKVRERKR